MSAAEVIDIRRASIARTASFAEPVKTLPFRLPPIHETDLRILFTELETDAGVKTRYWADFERAMGVVDSSAGTDMGTRGNEEDVHLFELERHCDRARVWSPTGRSARMSRCRAALVALGETAEGRAKVIFLHLTYGLPTPNAPYQHFSREIAPLAHHTPAVEARRRELVATLAAAITARTRVAADVHETERTEAIARTTVALDDARARIAALEDRVARTVLKISKLRERFGTVPRAMKARRPIAKKIRACRKSQQRSIVAIRRAREGLPEIAATLAHIKRQRPSAAAGSQTATEIARGADNAVTSADALAAALDVRVDKRDRETEAERKTRRKAAEAARGDFLRTVTREAARMLADASLAYLSARVAR